MCEFVVNINTKKKKKEPKNKQSLRKFSGEPMHKCMCVNRINVQRFYNKEAL